MSREGRMMGGELVSSLSFELFRRREEVGG